jgi:Domain of unknown function (DUF4279)
VQTTATFRLFGSSAMTAAAVTRRLGIQPTCALEAGDPVSSRSARTRDSSAWLLSSSPSPSPSPEDGTELTEHLDQVLATSSQPPPCDGSWSTKATRRTGPATSPHTPPNTQPNSTGLPCNDSCLCPAPSGSTSVAMAQTINNDSQPVTRQTKARSRALYCWNTNRRVLDGSGEERRVDPDGVFPK